MGEAHGMSPEPWGRGCVLSLEMGAREVGGNQVTRASKAVVRSSCFLHLVLGEKSFKLGKERIRFVTSEDLARREAPRKAN